MENANAFSKGILLSQAKEHLESKQGPLSALETDLKELIIFDKLTLIERESLSKRLLDLTLLSDGKVNPKTAKTLAGFEFNNYILHLSPSDLSGVNLCPNASAGCRSACLNAAGRGAFASVQYARLRKTLYFLKLRAQFIEHLDSELKRAVRHSQGTKVAVRLNGTSDISWERLRLPSNRLETLITANPEIIFYDYTKVASRFLYRKLPSNYSLTFSASETNSLEVKQALFAGVNVAMVFHGTALPASYKGFEVLDGDAHDFRFLDKRSKRGVLIGLKAKGPAKRDTSGFVRPAVIEASEVKRSAR